MIGIMLLASGKSVLADQVKVQAKEEKTEVKSSTQREKQWQLAKRAGYSREQFDHIMDMPTIDATLETTKQVSRAMDNELANMTPQQKKVVDMAQKQLGIPYVFGGTNPNEGFDCSGLVQYVYKKAVNQNLPRVTTDQQRVGNEIFFTANQPSKTLDPGDLVFYGYPNSYHVAIYVGNDQIIQAPQPGQTVQQVNMHYFMPNHARRVLTPGTNKPEATKINEYRTVTSKDGKVWRNLDKTAVKADVSQYYDKTIRLKYKYEVNKETLYSAYNDKDEWLGYFSESLLSEPQKTPGGVFHKTNQYVSVTKDNYTLWRDFNFKNKKGKSAQIYHQTVKVKGYYNHFNGSRYYSLYDSHDNWLGYINCGGVKNSTVNGSRYDANGYVTIPDKAGILYQTIDLLQEKYHYSQFKNTTAEVRNQYTRFDGIKVYSLYNKDDRWLGYIDANQLKWTDNPGGIYQSYGKKVRIIKNNYTLWRNLTFKNKKGISDTYYGCTLLAKGRYYHHNGSVYYSLYDDQNNWLGYINAKGTKVQ